MTKQETFDIVAKHLLDQNQRAVADGICRYRHNDLKCAAGVLIPDDEYLPCMEGHSVCPCPSEQRAVEPVLIRHGHDLDLVRNLQNVHDNDPLQDWHTNLRTLALTHNLSPAVIDNHPRVKEKECQAAASKS